MNLQLLLAWVLTFHLLPAAQNPSIRMSAQAGYDGLYEESAPVPVTVFVRNDGAPVEGEVQVVVPAAGGDELIYSAPVPLPTGADKRVPLVVYLPPFAGEVAVRLVGADGVLAETTSERLSSVGRDELLYGVVTPDPGGLTFLETVSGGSTGAAVAFLDVADLPEVSSAWNALDVLVLDDTDTARLTNGQRTALRAWVESGGRLVVTGGPGGTQTAAGVADLLPIAVTGVSSVDNLTALADFAGRPLETPGPYVITTGAPSGGEVEVLIEQDGTPLLARRELGRGQVVFLALDPGSAPLAGWAGSAALWTVAAGAPATPPWGGGIRDGYAAMQAVSAVPGLRLPSVGQLIFFLFLYTVVIGPINFFILRRLNRRELAWVTVPALVLLFSAATFLTGFSTRGDDATLNVMSVAFGSAEAERVQAQSVLGLYSPRRGQYDIVLPYDTSAFPFQEGFGTLAAAGDLAAVARASDLTLQSVRADTGQVATFIADAHPSRPPISATARLGDAAGAVEVVVRNGAADTLENAVLIHGQQQTALGDLAPGEERTVELPLPTPTAPTTAPTPDPLFPSALVIPNPLLNDPAPLLGTPDYFSDPDAYPRWQLLQSHFAGDPANPEMLPDPREIITLAGWLPGGLLPATVSGQSSVPTGVTLLLLEIPVR